MIEKYIVVEIQTNTDGTVGNLVFAYDDLNEAESKYHAILSAAAISTLPFHVAFLLKNDGWTIKSDGYRHEEVENNDGGTISN